MTGNYQTERERFGPVMLASNIVFFKLALRSTVRLCELHRIPRCLSRAIASWGSYLRDSARNPTLRRRVSIALFDRSDSERRLPARATGCQTRRTPIDLNRVAVQAGFGSIKAQALNLLFSRLGNSWCRGVEVLTRYR